MFYGANDDDRWNCPCVLCPVSSWFLTDGPEMSPNVTFTVLQCVLCSFPLLNGLERSQFHYIWWLILRWSWNESKMHCIQMVLKEVKIQRVSPMEISMLSIEVSSMEVCKLYNSNVMVMKGVNLMLFSTVYVSDGLERSQFCSYTQWSWKESISDANFTMHIPNGLERSQICLYRWWSWKESISDDLPYRPLWWSWKRSLFGANFLLGLNLGLSLYPVGCQWWCFC